MKMMQDVNTMWLKNRPLAVMWLWEAMITKMLRWKMWDVKNGASSGRAGTWLVLFTLVFLAARAMPGA